MIRGPAGPKKAAPGRLGQRGVERQEAQMQTRSRWTGWIGFAGWLLVVIGVVDFFEGLIAIIRGQYYVLTPNQIIVFNMKGWGWITLIWGIVATIAGLSLLSGASWARWFAIVVGSLNVIGQLGFVGSSQYPLWALTAVGLSVVVIYALIVRWDEVQASAVNSP
jgi:hypothetical protein